MSELFDLRDELALGAATADHRVGEPAHPAEVVVAAEADEAGAVSADIGRDRHADRRGNEQGQAAHEEPRDQHASDPTVAVGERMDDLELRVRDRGLRDGVEVDTVDPDEEVVEERPEAVGGRGDEVGVERAGAPDPALLVADATDVALRRRAPVIRSAVPAAEGVDVERGAGRRGLVDGRDHRRERGGHPRGGVGGGARPSRPRRGRRRAPAR